MQLPFEAPVFPGLEGIDVPYVILFTTLLVAGCLGALILARVLQGSTGPRAKCLILQQRHGVYFLLKEKKVPVTKSDFTYTKHKSFKMDLNFTSYLNANRPVIFFDFDKALPIPVMMDGSKITLTSANYHMLNAQKIIGQAVASLGGFKWDIITLVMGAVIGLSVGIMIGVFMPMPGTMVPPTNTTTNVSNPFPGVGP